MVIAAQLRDWRFSRPAGAAFAGVTALLFTGSAALTILGCASMAAMGGMPMPGGWTMSMSWMRMAGQTWLGAAASFTGMWVVMMMAMMLPSLAPLLWRGCEAVANTGGMHPDSLAALVGLGYFLVWAAIGVAIYPIGSALAAVEMQRAPLARAVPVAASVVVLLGGAFQFTPWKARRRARLADTTQSLMPLGCEWLSPVPTDAFTAWRFGLRLGLYCTRGCAGLTAILLVLGIMDLRAMAVITAAITAERLAPNGERVARAIGTAAIAAGLFLIAKAAGLSLVG